MLPSCYIDVRQLGRATDKSAKEIKELQEAVFATLPPLQVEYINGRCTIAARNEEQLANVKLGLMQSVSTYCEPSATTCCRTNAPEMLRSFAS